MILSALFVAITSSAEPKSIDLLNKANSELDEYQRSFTTESPKDRTAPETISICSPGAGNNEEDAISAAKKAVRIEVSQRISGSKIGTWTSVMRGLERITEGTKNLERTLDTGLSDEIPGKYLPPIDYEKISLTKEVSTGDNNSNIERYMAAVCGKVEIKQLKFGEFKFFYEEALSIWQVAMETNDRVKILRLATALESFIKDVPVLHEYSPESMKIFQVNLLTPLRSKVQQINRIEDGNVKVLIVGAPEDIIPVVKYIQGNFPKADIKSIYFSQVNKNIFIISPFQEVKTMVAGIQKNFSITKAKIEELPYMTNVDIKIFISPNFINKLFNFLNKVKKQLLQLTKNKDVDIKPDRSFIVNNKKFVNIRLKPSILSPIVGQIAIESIDKTNIICENFWCKIPEGYIYQSFNQPLIKIVKEGGYLFKSGKKLRPLIKGESFIFIGKINFKGEKQKYFLGNDPRWGNIYFKEEYGQKIGKK
jgi:hypothetical protein